MDAFGPMSSNWIEENIDEIPNEESKKFFEMLETTKKALYKGCELSLLLVVPRLINIKCEFNIPNRVVGNMLSLMKEICLPDNEMSATYYSAKKLLTALQLPHERIDARPNGCMLYWKDKVDLERCEHYEGDRYEKQKLRSTDRCVPLESLLYK